MRWIGRLLAALLLIAVFFVGALFLLPKDRIAAIATDQLKAQTGRDLTVTDELSLSIWPVIGVKTGPVSLSNADWAGQAPMIAAQSLSIGVQARALIGGAIRITHLEADGPVLRLATDAEGRGNWEFGAPAQSASSGSADPASSGDLTIEHLNLTNARIVFSAHGAAPVEVGNLDLKLDWPEPSAPAEFDMAWRAGSSPVTANGQIDKFDAFLSGQVSRLSVHAQAEGGAVTFTGRANMAGDAAGQVQVNSKDTGALLAAFGLPISDLPRGLGQTLDAQAAVTFTDNARLSLRDMVLVSDQNTVSGEADIVLENPPRLTASLRGGALDLSAGAPSAAPASDGTAASDGWSTTPIDASALALVNADIAFRADAIDLGSVQVGPSRMTLGIDRARAVLRLADMSVFGGAVSGQLVANNRNGLSVGGNLAASQIDMEQMLGGLMDITRLSGASDAQIEFLGVGQSVDTIMRSLSGSGGFAMGRGVITGLDLDRVMRTGDATGGTTVFDSLTADFTMQNGNLENDNLLLLLKNFRAEGVGRVGLGARDIDYLFTPIALRANAGQGLAIPVRVRGPWANPRVTPDLEQALQLDVDGKVEEVKQKARDRVQEKLQEELGVQVEEGQSTEDSIKDALEDRAKDSLRRLLLGD